MKYVIAGYKDGINDAYKVLESTDSTLTLQYTNEVGDLAYTPLGLSQKCSVVDNDGELTFTIDDQVITLNICRVADLMVLYRIFRVKQLKEGKLPEIFILKGKKLGDL